MPLFGAKKEPERQPASAGIRKPSGVTSGQTQQMIRERGTKQGASSSQPGGISWKDYNRYEQDYNGWKTTGQHGADFGSWATDSGLQSWKSIRDRAKTGAQAALIGDTYHVLDKDTYDRYEKDYSYWKKTGKHTKDFDSWADQGQLDTWRTIRDYNIGVKAGKNPSMELQSTINGLDPEVLRQVQETYRSSWKYGTTDEDLARKAQGLPPKSKDKYYKRGTEFDSWLYSQGLPSTQGDYFQQLYDAAAQDIAARRQAQAASGTQQAPAVRGQDLSAEQAKAIAEAWRGDWSYASSTEDKARKRGGRMPKSVEAMYTDSEADQWNKANGLPPAALLPDYMGVQAGNASPEAAAVSGTGKKAKGAETAAPTEHIDFTGREQLQEEIARLFKGDWSYADTPEDKARKRAGRPPKKVEDAYTDTAADRWYKKNGLPPASMIDAYMPTQGDMAAMVSDPMRAIREAGTRPSAMPTQEDLLDAVTGGEAPAAETAAEAAPEKTQAERYAENARDRGVRREILERQGVPEDVLDAVYGPEEKPAADRAGAAAPDEIDAVTGASEYGERSAGEAPAEEAGEAAGPGKWGDLIGERYVPGREPMRAEAGEEGEVSDLLDREPGSAERTAIGTAEPGGPERAALGRNVGPTVRKAQAGPVRMAQKKEDTQLLMFLEGQKDAGVSRDEIEAYDTDGMFGQDLLDAVFGEEPAAPQGAPDPYAARPYSVDEEWWNALVDEAVSERDSGHDRQWVEDSDQWNDPTSQAVLDAVFGQKSAEQVDYEREAAKARQEAIEQEKEERRARMADASAWAEEDAAIMQANLEATYASEMGIDPSLYGTPEELAQRNLDPNAPSTAPDFLYSADGLPASQLEERIGYIDKYLAKIYEETPRTPWEVLHGLSEGEAGATIADLEAQQAKLRAIAASARSTEAVEESAKLYAAVSQRTDWQDGSAPIPYEEIGSYARTRDERNILKVFDGISPWEEGRDAREQELDEYGPRVDGKYASVYYMSDGERGVFRYLARTKSMDAAMEYVDRLLPALNARSYEETAEIAAYASKHHPILTTLWNVTGGQLVSAGEGIVTGISALANDMTDGAVGTQLVENDPRLRATAAKQMMQAKIRSQIVETSGSETWGMVYDLAASIAENGVRAVLFGGAPGGQIMSATTMYGQVFASTVYEYMNEKHADYKTAIFAGLLDAGAEALGEAIDFGAFLSMKSELNAGKATGRMIAQYMLKNILTEGGSEAITSVTEKAIDYLLMQDDSEMAKLWQETYEKTGDRTEAWKAVLGTAGKDALIEGVSGAISGLFLSGGNVVFNRMRYGSGAGRATMIAGLTEGTDVNTDAAIAGDYIERAIRKGGANMSADERMAMLHEIRGMDTLTEAQKSHYMDMLESFGSLPQSMTSEETKGAIADVKEATAQASMTKAEIRAKAASRSARKQGQLQTKMDRVQAAAAEMRAAQDPAAITEAAAKVQQETAAYQTAFDQAQAEEQAAQQEDALAVERAQGPVQQKLARLESMADKEAGHFDEQLDQAVAEQAGAALEQQIGPYAAEDLRKQFNVWANDENHWINSLPTSEYNAILREVENYFEAVSNGQDAYSSERLAEVMEAARNETSYDEYAAENAYAPEASAAAEEQGIGRTGEERLEIEGDRAVIEREYQQERDALEVRQDEAEMSGDEQAVREIESEIRELDEQHAQLIEEMDAEQEEAYGTEEAGAGNGILEGERSGADVPGYAGQEGNGSEASGVGQAAQSSLAEPGTSAAEAEIAQAPATPQQEADLRRIEQDLIRNGRPVAAGAIRIAKSVRANVRAALDMLSRITGIEPTVLIETDDESVPYGARIKGTRRTYARNGKNVIFHAAHEHAHNMPAVIHAISGLIDSNKVLSDAFDAYMENRKAKNLIAVDQEGGRTEFACDVFGAFMQDSIDGNARGLDMLKRLGLSERDLGTLYNAIKEALAYDPETEMSDEESATYSMENAGDESEGVEYSSTDDEGDDRQRITVGMSDEERERILRRKGTFVASEYKGQAEGYVRSLADEKISSSDLRRDEFDLVESAVKKAADELGVPSELFNKDTELTVYFSNGTIRETTHKQVKGAENMLRLLPVLKDAVQNAIGIDVLDNRYYFDSSTLFFANLLGGYTDGDYLIPVRFGIKAARDGRNALYVVISDQRIKTAEVKAPPPLGNPGRDGTRSAIISLPSLIRNVNNPDILKYLPDGMLSSRQREIKWEAISKSAAYTNKKNDKHYLAFVKKGDMRNAGRMVDAAAESAMRNSKVRGKDGKLVRVYHGTDADFRVFDHSKIGTTGTMYGEGFYFTDSKYAAGAYQKTDASDKPIMAGYLDIRRPASYDSVTFTRQEMMRLLDALTEDGDLTVLEGFARSSKGYGSDAWIRQAKQDAADALLESSDDRVIIDTITTLLGGDECLSTIRKVTGIDGFISTDGRGNGIYVAFDSNQFKKAAPVTYHPDGSIVNISDRFNLEEDDINYSDDGLGLEDDTEDGQGDLLDAALPVYDITPNGRSAEQESGTAAAAERTGGLAEEQGNLLDAVLPQKTEAQKRAERRARDRENRKRRQQEKAQREREAAEKRRIEQGLFAPDASMDAMEARTQRVRMTDQAGMTAKEMTDLIDNLTGQFETPTEKTPNPKDVGRVARRILKNESGATMDELELTRRLTELTSAYRNNPDKSAADSDLFDEASKLATDVVDSMEVTLADAVGEEAHYQRLIDHLRETPIKVGPRGRQQLKDAFGNLREFRAAVGNDSILDIRWVDDDKQSTYEDLGGTINGYLDEEVRQQIEEAFGETNTIDIVELAEFVQADRLGEHEPMHSFRDVYGQDVYDEEAANLLAEIIHAVTKTGIIGNQATYAQRGARAMADVGRDLGRIRELAQQQLENIRGIRDAGNEEARIATTSAARARQMWQEGYRQNQRENAQLAERNARLNEENERLARSETALEARRDYDRQERSLLRQSLTDEQTENRQLLKENERLGARERRRKDVLRQAEELFRAGKSARDYYEETRSDPDSYDHEVARQLNGMRLRNGQDVGGRINTQAFQSILDRSNKFAEQGALKLSFESPVRVFEEVAGRYSRKNSNRENARVYRDRKLMGDTYVEYGNAMMSERESYIAEHRERIREAWEGHGRTTAFDSAAVQLLGEKICDETQIRDALQDGHTMVVNGIDGTFVFEKKGNAMRLRAFSDAQTTYVYPKGSAKPVGIDGALTVNRRGSSVRVTDGNGTVVADIRNGRGLNTEAVTATRDALRSYYDAALQEQNRVLVENGYAPIHQVQDYFPHLGRQESGIRGFMQQLRADNLPTGINGLTATFTPGHPWAAHMQQRLGERTEFDAIRGFNAYVEAAGDQIYKTPVVQRLRQLENGLRRNAGRSDTTNAAFVAWLKEYTNQFANKKASLDRDMEDIAGRNTYSLSRFLTGAFSTAAVGGNVSSSLSNLVSWLTGAAHLNPGRVGGAAVRTIAQNMARLARGEDRYDGFAAKIPYLNRAFNGSDRIAVTRMDRIKTAGGKALYALFSAVDRFSKESIGRAVYDGCMAKGMSEQEAIKRTDDFLIKNFADRGTGQAARVFGIKWLKPFAQFQLEVLNQQYQFRDIKNEEFERKIEKAMKDVQASDPDAVDWDALGRKISVHGPREALKKAAYLALLSLWGMLTRELMGRDQSWNVAGTGKDIARAIGKIDPEERNALNVGKAVGTELWNAVSDNAPFISMITGGGRVPVLGGITNLLSYGKNALFGKDLDPLDRALYGVRAVANFVPGGGQLSKTIRGAAAVSRGGQYNAKGTRLQFPVAQTPGNWARGLAFGPSAMQPEGYDFEKDVLSEKKTEAFKEATSPDYGMDPEAAYTILHGYGGSTNAAKSASLAAGIIESGVEDPGGTFDFFSELMGYKRGMKRNGLDLPAFVREDVEARKAALPAKVESGEKTQEEADAEIRELDRFLERIMAG